MDITGGCHCGNISFALDWRPEPTEIPARACSCTFCVKHGGVWTACPEGRLRVRIAVPAAVSNYVFGTRTATFHVCMRCGVVPVVSSHIDGRDYAVVNVHAFQGVDPALLRSLPASFDGEGEAERLVRRQRNWIGGVEFFSEPAGSGLFSYGSLQHADVQRATFGRTLAAQPDELPGFERAASRGPAGHANVIRSASADSRVGGVVLELTDVDLARADEYERGEAYERIEVTLASGRRCWVYREAESKS